MILAAAHVTLGHEIGALALTLAIETPIYALLLHHLLAVPVRRAAGCGIGVNLVSHPLAFAAVGPGLAVALGPVSSVVVAEIGVAWLGEAALVRWLTGAESWSAIGISFVANAASFSIGLVLTRR